MGHRWSLGALNEQKGKLGVTGQLPGQCPEVLLLPRELDYRLLQPWQRQETEDPRATGGPENLCCCLKKKIRQRISVVLVVRQKGFEKRLPCRQQGSTCQSA